MNIRITCLMAVVLGVVACSAAPTNSGHYETYLASLCAHSSDLWNAQGNNQFTYEPTVAGSTVEFETPFTLDVTALIQGEPPPGQVTVSEEPDLINLSVRTDLVSPHDGTRKYTTCGNSVCNTGECVTVLGRNPSSVEWVNLAPENGTYHSSQEVAFDFSAYMDGNPSLACDGADYSSVPTTVEAALVIGDTAVQSSFVVRLTANQMPLKPSCANTAVNFDYVSGGLSNVLLLNSIAAKRQEAHAEYELRLAEGVEATLRQSLAGLGALSASDPAYQIRDRSTDAVQIDGLLGSGIAAAEQFASWLGKDITPYTGTITSILSNIGVTDVAEGQEALAFAQSLLGGEFGIEDIKSLVPEEQQVFFDMIEQGLSDAVTESELAGTELADARALIDDLRNQIGGAAGVSTFDPEADNPHGLPVSYDGDPKDCTMKCQVDPDTMEPYANCPNYRQRFLPGVAQGMTAGTHYRAAWYEGVGTVAQVCHDVTIPRANGGEPLVEWKWHTYKPIHNNPNGYKCGDWAPSLGETSHCPYSEANGLTCGVWSNEYCEP